MIHLSKFLMFYTLFLEISKIKIRENLVHAKFNTPEIWIGAKINTFKVATMWTLSASFSLGGKIQKNTVWRSVFLTIHHCLLDADSTKTHSSRVTFTATLIAWNAKILLNANKLSNLFSQWRALPFGCVFRRISITCGFVFGQMHEGVFI